MRARPPHWFCCLMLLPCLSACKSEQPDASTPPLASQGAVAAEPVAADDQNPPAAEASAIKAEDVKVTIVKDAASLHQAIAELKGKVVVLNFWATWCPTCVEEFPHLVAACRAAKDQDVVLVTVSGDYPEDIDPKVKPFLAEHGVVDHAFLTEVEDEVKFIDAYGDEFEGDYPTTITYSKTGQRVATHSGEATREQFDELIRQAIAAE